MSLPLLAAPPPTQTTLSCPRCRIDLTARDERLWCGGCAASWEVRDGIPRFVTSTEYWGEVPQAAATSLLDEAATIGWRQAAAGHFADDPMLAFSILQWQNRASWLPLLGLPPEAVALDIGSGYGAITHALAKSCHEVYSIEAINERVQFTAIRTMQEGLTNVRLVQASATEMPLPENHFDLIVVNGVLEWVGEWNLNLSPRDVQLRFLRDLHRSLKPGGVVVIGIENRIGYNNFRGALDHSGLPYTSLMPRWMASLRLRLSSRTHYRTRLNAKRQYRTYTYSERGYRKLLRASGFDNLTFYTADPGYNQPLMMVPLEGTALESHILHEMSDPDAGARPRWPRLLKYQLSRLRLLHPFVPEFVIIAGKDAHYAD